VGTSLAAEPLLSLAVSVASEQRVESVLQKIVQGLASQPGVALARIWLRPSADLPGCSAGSDSDDLCLVASAGTPIHSPGEDWSFLRGQFARVPFHVGKVGQVAASRSPILVEDVAAQNDWVVRPDWAKREEIHGFAGHPLIFRDKLLGVIGVFSREILGQQEFTWLGLFANQAAVAIANARAFEEVERLRRDLRSIINTIPTTAWTARADGYCDFINQVWLDYSGITAEQAQGWGWAEAIHPDDRKRLVEQWQSCLASGTPVDTEARIRRFDGSYRWFLIRANPLRDESGNILKWYGTCIDIDDRKRGEEALRLREPSWRQIVDNIPGLVATTGTLGEVEFLNRQTLEYFGNTSEELKDWALIGAVHPDDLPRVIEVRKKSIETGQIYEVEHRCRRADGVYRWFQVRGLPARDTEGKARGWYVLLTDIDDRKRAEQELKRSEEFLAEGQRHSRTGTFCWRVTTDEITWSEQLYRIFEFDERLPVTLERIGSRVHPDDLPLLQDMLERARNAASDFEYYHRVVMPDRSVKHIRLFAHATRDKYGQLEYIGAAQDVTDMKVAEEALRASERNLKLMINAIPTFIGVLRTDGSVLYANQTVLDYTGVTLEDMQEGDYRVRFFHPEDLERLREERREALTRAMPFENEQRLLGKDGKYRWFLTRYNPLLDEEGRIDRWYMAATDIEDRKRAENVRLEERTRIARELHDTLLQTVQAASLHLGAALYDMTPDSPVKPRLERVVQLMSQGIAEGREAIQGLRVSESDTSDLVLALSRIRQELKVPPDIDFRVTVTGAQKPLPSDIQHEIYRIGREALVNAFCHAGAKAVELEVEYSDNALFMRVRDNGCGIDAQVLDKGRDGHWGLAGMRERATRLGGFLRVLSRPTGGTEVQFSLPSSIVLERSHKYKSA
jgi:PAS domain S-box-containing protein